MFKCPDGKDSQCSLLTKSRTKKKRRLRQRRGLQLVRVLRWRCHQRQHGPDGRGRLLGRGLGRRLPEGQDGVRVPGPERTDDGGRGGCAGQEAGLLKEICRGQDSSMAVAHARPGGGGRRDGERKAGPGGNGGDRQELTEGGSFCPAPGGLCRDGSVGQGVRAVGRCCGTCGLRTGLSPG